MIKDKFYSPTEFAKELGLCSRTITRWIETGKLKAVSWTDGKRPLLRIPKEEMDKFKAE